MQHHTTMARGVNTHWVTVGSGPVGLVMLHGWGGSTDSFTETGLSEQIANELGKTVVCVDVPGFGQSSMPPAHGWSSAESAVWLQELIEHNQWQGIPLFGHSNGGRIVLWHAQAFPHHSPLVLSGAAGVRWPKTFFQKITTWLSHLCKPLKRVVPTRLWNMVTQKVFRAHDWNQCPGPLKATLAKILQEPDVRSFLPQIENKTLLIWGDLDTMTPLKSGQVLQDALPDAQMKRFSDGQHGTHRTHTKPLAEAVVTFLSE